MNGGLKWKLIAGFILVFVAGVMSGVFCTAFYAHHFFAEMHQPGMMAARMKDHLRAELKLTPEQMEKISPIVDRTAEQLEQIRMETGKRVHETFTTAHSEMSTYLTDGQKQRLQRMEQQHRRMHMLHGAPPPPGAPLPE